MRILNDTALTFGFTTWRFDPKQDAMVVIVKGTFALRHGERAIWAENPEHVGGDVFDSSEIAASAEELGALRYASDAVPFKPKADALLTGTLHTPKGQRMRACSASFAVGSASLELLVTGDRYWLEPSSGKMSEPEPFSEMPLSYRRAFGGAGYAHNPVGKGVFGDHAKQPVERPLPNIEDPGALITSASARPAPAGFGPLAAHWSYRMSRWPRFEPGWLEERWPWAPAELDYSYFNAAQPGLQIAGYLRGDETIACENLHPSVRRYQSRLPGVRPRCFVADAPSESPRTGSAGRTGSGSPSSVPRGGRFREASLRLDTLSIDMDTEQLVLVWRGHVPVASEELDDVGYVFLGAESLDDKPLSVEHYQQRFEVSRIAAEGDVRPHAPPSNDNDAQNIMSTATPVPAAAVAPVPAIAAVPAIAPAPEVVEVEEATALLPPDIRRLMERSGTPPEVIALCDKGDADGAVRKLTELTGVSQAEIDSLQSRITEQLKGFLVQAGHDPSILDPPPPPPPAAAPAKPPPAAIAPWSRQRVVLCLETDTPLAGVDLHGLDLSRLDFSGRDLTGTLLQGCDLTDSFFEDAKLEQADLSRAKATRARMRRAKLADADLTALDGVECDLSEAELSGAMLNDAVLESARLTGCIARGASLVKTRLASARLDKADLSGAQLHGAVLDNANLREADLSSARAERISAANADFSRARLSKWNASEGSKFTGANFRNVQSEGSNWMRSDLTGADFSGAKLSRADLSRSVLVGAKLGDSDLRDVDFTAANLRKAQLLGANLWGARFERADLRQADLRAASLYQAQLWQAKLAGADLSGANTTGTLLGTPVQGAALSHEGGS